MNELPGLSDPSIRAGLLHIQAMRKEGKIDDVECVQRAYDVIAQAWATAGSRLVDSELKDRIPELVFEGAIEFGWIEYPLWRYARITQRNPDSYIPGAAVSRLVRETIPDSKLVENLGRFRVTAAFKEHFVTGVLGGRVAEWQARRYEREAESPLGPKTQSRRARTRDKKVIGDNIERLRNECDLTYDELARRSGIGRTEILGHVHHKTKPYVRTLKLYAATFSKELKRTITVDDLLSDRDSTRE